MMKEQNMKMNELQFATTSHDLKHCRSANMSPASSEKHACIEADSLLLIDKMATCLKMVKVFLLKNS